MMAYPFGGSGRALMAYRGSRRRLRKIRMRGNSSFIVWALLILALLIVFVGVPWAMRHRVPKPEHVFGASEGR
jgi:hypothetical protein